MRPQKPLGRSRLIAPAAVTAIIAVLGAGFWFAAQFQSSAQHEANAKAPSPGPVLAEVTHGTLAEEMRFTGHVGPSLQTPVTLLPIPETSIAVVTGHPLEAGASTTSGQLLTEVNGRPVFGVHTPFAFYRDIGPGDRGPDVEALQIALAARSYPVKPDGRYGAETAAAVRRWYRDSGYDAASRSTTDTEKDRQGGGDAPVTSPSPMPSTGEYVPLTELVAIPTSSARVVQGVQIGQRVAEEGRPDLILGSADLVVTVVVSVAELGDVRAGDDATVSVDGAEIVGVVGDITPTATAEPDAGSPSAAEDSGAASDVTFVVTPATSLPASASRAQVTVIEEIVAEDALIVPVLAVSDRGRGKSVLRTQQDDGTIMEVPVTVLGSVHGEVAVKPTEDRALEAGDRVVVG